MRRIVIHPGMGKTGSSAIQAYLADNQDLLESLGLFYKCPALNHSREITSGNGVPLFNALQEFRFSDSLDFLEEHTSPQKISIISSESLAHLTSDHWYSLKKFCEKNYFKIEKIIMYLRNVDSFLVSGYDQNVKRHGCMQDFYQFAAENLYEHYNASFKIFKIFDRDILTPLHYESQKNSLMHSFLCQIVDISPRLEQQLMQATKISVNRSLTKLERSYLLKLNSKFGDLHSQKLSDRFINENPDLSKDEITYGENIRDIIKNRFQNQVNWINEKMFNNKPMISLCTAVSKIEKLKNNRCEDQKTQKIFNDYLYENKINF